MTAQNKSPKKKAEPTAKPKVAFYWCASCGGCEESIVDLAEGILEESDKSSWSLKRGSEEELFIGVKREGEVPGTHRIEYNSEVDSIEIKHTAHSRTGFALGAVVAAEWLLRKKGVFSMKDVLEL